MTAKVITCTYSFIILLVYLNSSLSDVSTNLQNIQEAMTSLGNGNIEIELDHDDYHGYFIVIVDTEKRIKFVFGEKAGTEIRAY